MKRLIFAISVLSFLIPFNKSFCQPFHPTKNNEKVNFENDSEIVEYPKHILYAQLDTSLISDTSFLQNVINFISSNNSKIISITASEEQSPVISNFLYNENIMKKVTSNNYMTPGRIEIRLADTMDAMISFDSFLNSGFFIEVNFGVFIYKGGFIFETKDTHFLSPPISKVNQERIFADLNYQIIKDDTNGITTRIYKDGSRNSYFTNELMFRIDTNNRNDSSFMYRLDNFLKSLNSRIAFFNYDNPPLNTLNGTGIIVSESKMDVYEYLNIFTQSGLFIDISPNGAGKLNGN